MAITRNYLYDKHYQDASFFAKALGHPARMILLLQLFFDGPCTVQALSIMHPLSQPSISQHLKILRKANLVICKEKFPFTYYRLNPKYFAMFKKELMDFLKKF